MNGRGYSDFTMVKGILGTPLQAQRKPLTKGKYLPQDLQSKCVLYQLYRFLFSSMFFQKCCSLKRFKKSAIEQES